MAINFRGGPPKGPSTRPTDPIKIFQARPALNSQITDLWRGQAQALEEWYRASQNDILISLNTGAGKSLLGTLICQSWLNGGVDNPVYLCATNDLVEQTASEAEKLALKFTTRTGGRYSNELFESGQGFLITSYKTLFNARTVLRGALSPKGIVFDDAHVGEPIIRDQYTLRIDKTRHASVYSAILDVISRHLSVSDRQRLRLVLGATGPGDAFLCPPETGGLLDELLVSNSASFNEPDVLFPYQLLATHAAACAVVVRTSFIELSPPFLPTRTVPALHGRDIKRVYLSATLKAQSEFVRAYGRKPDLIIEPEVDAGNGERTILNSRKLADREQLPSWAYHQSRSGKILIAVPSRAKANIWAQVAAPPEAAQFNAELKQFRAASKGGFLLAGRFDGIDLPDAVCRLMIISGLPAGGSALETYLWGVFEMQNLLAARVATRITQLFGRIIRGRNDYGIFVIHGADLLNWLGRDRNLALLPELLQKQVKLGQTLSDEFDISSLSRVSEFYEQVLERESGWLEYYRQYVDELDIDHLDVGRRFRNEEAQLMSSVAEAKFVERMWAGSFSVAAEELDAISDKVAEQDSKLAGWLNLWSGAARGLSANLESAREQYRLAQSRLTLHMDLPVGEEGDASGYVPFGAADAALAALVQLTQRQFESQTRRTVTLATSASMPTSTYAASEEAYRAVGAFLGFRSSRPDEEFGAGPDVLWIDDVNKQAISLELKTEKNPQSDLTKKEIGQSHNHVQWVSDNHGDVDLIQHFIVGHSLSVASNASPSSDWCHSEPVALLTLVQAFIAEAQRVRSLGSEEKKVEIARIGESRDWSAEAIVRRLGNRPIAE